LKHGSPGSIDIGTPIVDAISSFQDSESRSISIVRLALVTSVTWSGLPLVMLRLAAVDVKRLGELVTDAWRMRAPDAFTDNRNKSEDLPSADLG